MSTLEKTAFLVSFGVLAWLYGFATSARGWFPSDLVERAWHQGRVLASRGDAPVYLHERIFDRHGARTLVPGALQPGLTLVTSAWTGPAGLTPGLRLIDEAGEVLHAWRVDALEVFDDPKHPMFSQNDLDIQGSLLLPDGDVVANIEYVGTVRLDACGTVRWRLRDGNHHSVAQGEDGTFWIPAVTPERRPASPAYPDGIPGLRTPVYQDMIMHVSPEGVVLDTIHVLDVIYANDLERYLVREGRLGAGDPTHLNDVEPLGDSLAGEYPLFEAGDLLVSLRNLNMVLVLDPRSERVRWHASDPFIAQHDPDFIGDGWIGVFDNRRDGTPTGELLGGSRIVALQPHTGDVRLLFPTERSDRFHTAHRGKWQVLPNGNLLLTEEQAGRVLEVSPEGETVWEWIVEGYDGRTPSVTKATRVSLTASDVAAWPCSG